MVWYQVDFVYLTGRVFELVGLASDLRVEVPTKLFDPQQPPEGFPALLWSLWAAVLGTAWYARTRRASCRASCRAPGDALGRAARVAVPPLEELDAIDGSDEKPLMAHRRER